MSELKEGQIVVNFAELHDGIFIAGKQMGQKLDPKGPGFSNLKMVYDKNDKELLVTWGPTTAHVPFTNIKSYIPGFLPDRKIVQSAHPMQAVVSHTAQVETPMSHVHAGHGHGKTGKSK